MNKNMAGGVLQGRRIWGSYSALALLTAIGCGEVTSLGENDGGGGGSGSSADVTDGAGKANGGTASKTDGGGQAGGGYVIGGQAGGGYDSGGQAGGGQGGDGVEPAPLPYPLNPTVPISADCSCADDASTCNAAGECVPRCEPGGACALWRVDGGVLSMLTSNDTVYFIVDGQHDDLGNRVPGDAGQQSLWKVHYPEPAPTKLAVVGSDQLGLLAHVSDKTYIKTMRSDRNGVGHLGPVLAVSDEGDVVERDLPDDAGDVFVSSRGVFTLAVDGSIARLTIGNDGLFGAAFEALIPAADGANHLFAGDRLWRENARKLCSFDFADLQAAPRCLDVGVNDQILGAVGGRAVIQDSLTSSVDEVNVDEQTSRHLWVPTNSFWGGTMADGFVTGWVVDLNDIGASVLGRFPTEGAAKALTPLIGQDVVRAMAENGAQANYAPAATAVTSDAVYWSQSINDYQGPSVSRYIFRAPLPQ